MQEREERTWATLAHLGGIMGSFIVASVGNILGALIIWLIKRNESTFVNEQGKEALNFQITLSIANAVISLIAAIRLGFWSYNYNSMFFNRRDWNFNDMNIHSEAYVIGVLSGIIWILNIVFSVIAATRANKGMPYRYPLSLRLVK